MKIRKVRHQLRKSLSQRGLFATASHAIRKVLQSAPSSVDEPKPYARIHPFDQQFGVDTSGHLSPEDLASGTTEDLFNTGYFGVAPSALRQVLERLSPDFQSLTFVDLGSGKGRALLVASEYPFRAIFGVELSPALHAVAQSNLACYGGPNQQCNEIHAIHMDAAKFVFPSGPLLVYLWNPFEAPVLSRVLTNLEASLASHPREAYILYIQPDLEHLLQAGGRWRPLWREEFVLSENDYAAHAFPSRVETCSAYAAVTIS